MVPKSVLNDLRRRLLAQLAECRPQIAAETINQDALDQLRSAPFSPRTSVSHPQLTVLCRNLEQLQAVLDWAPPGEQSLPEMVYCDFEEVRLSREAVERARHSGQQVAVATPRIVKPTEEGLLLQIANCRPDAVLVRNLAALVFFKERFPDIGLIGDYSLNVANELTAGLFAEAGLKSLVASYDLNLDQLQALLAHCDPGLFEVVVHQHVPMFHMEHCIFSHALSNGKRLPRLWPAVRQTLCRAARSRQRKAIPGGRRRLPEYAVPAKPAAVGMFPTYRGSWAAVCGGFGSNCCASRPPKLGRCSTATRGCWRGPNRGRESGTNCRC